MVPVFDLQWEEPPAEALASATVDNTFYGRMAAALRARPGEWAKIPREYASEDSAKNTMSRIKNGRMAGINKGEIDAVHHEKSIWVRAVPKSAKPGDEAQPSGPRLVQAQAVRPANNGVSAAIRAWAKSNDYPDLPAQGRLPQDVIDAYHAAMDQVEAENP